MVGGGIMLLFSLFVMMYCEKIGSALNSTEPLPAQQAVFIISVILIFIAGNILQAPARTLCSDVVPQCQQVLMSNVCMVYGGIGGILTNLCGALELYKYTPLDQEQFVLVVCLSISGVALVITIVSTPEEPLKEKPESVNGFKQIWQACKRMPRSVSIALLAYFLGQFASYEYGIQFSHFMGKEIFKGDNASKDPELKNNYQSGLSWAMFCNVVYYIVQFVYSFVNTKLCERFTMRVMWIIFMAVLGLVYFSFYFISDKWAFMGLSIPLGICENIYCAIPYAIVSLAIPTEELGGNLGLLVCAGVTGQQVANFGIGSGLASLWDDSPRMIIGISAVPAILAAIAGIWIIQPGPDAYDEYRKNMYEPMLYTDGTNASPEF